MSPEDSILETLKDTCATPAAANAERHSATGSDISLIESYSTYSSRICPYGGYSLSVNDYNAGCFQECLQNLKICNGSAN